MTDVPQAKQRVRDGISALRSSILDLSHAVHSTPELAYEEVASSRFIADAAAAVPGSRVQVGLGTLPTALLAEVGSGELVVTLCAEYDALPGIGHACGHNIIAASAFGAFAALAPLADELGITVRLLGTPAEEHGGGKIDLLRQGFFDGSHAVLMVHPLHGTIGPVVLRTLASSAYRVTFTGSAAHASAQPWKGVNALDAMTIALTSIGLSRQQLEPGQQIHGFVDRAGDAPNVIPDSATGEWMIRATSMESLQLTGMLNSEFGVVNDLFFFGADINWLGDPWLARGAILFVNLWLSYPYWFLVCTGALQAMPSETLEAATIDGAGRWRQFRSIILPLLLVSTAPLAIASFAFNFNNFTIIYMLTGGGPNFADSATGLGSTDILISAIYQISGVAGGTADYGLASALSILVFIVIGVISALAFRQTRKLEELQ